MVRAKFYVTSITRSTGHRPTADGKWEPCELRTVKLSPVSGGSEENKAFWAASPSGSIELGCANLEAAAHFELGQEVYVDFQPLQKVKE